MNLSVKEGAPTYHSTGAHADEGKPSVAELEARRRRVLFRLHAALIAVLTAWAALGFVLAVLSLNGLFEAALEAVS